MPDTPRPLPVTARLLAGGTVSRSALEAEIARDLDPDAGITAHDVVATMLSAGWVGMVAADEPDGPAVLEMRPLRQPVR